MIHDKHDKAIPPGYMTVGEVAKKMGVTVRALQYYERHAPANRVKPHLY